MLIQIYRVEDIKTDLIPIHVCNKLTGENRYTWYFIFVRLLVLLNLTDYNWRT